VRTVQTRSAFSGDREERGGEPLECTNLSGENEVKSIVAIQRKTFAGESSQRRHWSLGNPFASADKGVTEVGARLAILAG
jgi:hypothetical protein